MLRKFLPLLLLAPASAAAQAPEGPPPVFAITREDIKPGQMGPHEKTAAGYVAMLAKANPDSYRLALVPVSGDQNAVLYTQGFPSFAAVEAEAKATEAALTSNVAYRAEMDRVEREGIAQHSSQRVSYYRYRADLSYRPMSPKDVGAARYVSLTTTRVKPGRLPDYADYLKGLNVAREKAGVTDIHSAVYEVVTGAPAGTLLILGTRQSLKDLDDDFARIPERQKAVDAALGGPDVVKMRRMLISEIIADSQNAIYAFAPAISRPPAFIAAGDPAFWTPAAKGPAKALATTKKDSSKP
jgi:hypothetical protein